MFRNWSSDSERRCRGDVVEACRGRQGVGQVDERYLFKVFEAVMNELRERPFAWMKGIAVQRVNE
jgi:hypothetical protein